MRQNLAMILLYRLWMQAQYIILLIILMNFFCQNMISLKMRSIRQGEEKNNVQFSIIYDENLNEYTKGQIGVEYVSRFGLTYVYQFEDLCLMYNEKRLL